MFVLEQLIRNAFELCEAALRAVRENGAPGTMALCVDKVPRERRCLPLFEERGREKKKYPNHLPTGRKDSRDSCQRASGDPWTLFIEGIAQETRKAPWPLMDDGRARGRASRHGARSSERGETLSVWPTLAGTARRDSSVLLGVIGRRSGPACYSMMFQRCS
ncbi:hypothetical protein KM043_008742 [Ampulex compressa]|nr:hypothetical protein KM043_008742 [Ampulex compressa]